MTFDLQWTNQGADAIAQSGWTDLYMITFHLTDTDMCQPAATTPTVDRLYHPVIPTADLMKLRAGE